jgi:enoyl-[acyl-carrier protein] reductase I
VLTHQGQRLEENVREQAATLPAGAADLILPLDVTSDAEIDAVFAAIGERHGGVDFLVHGAAFADREDLARPFYETSREGFKKALDISAFSLVALSRRAVPMMESRGGGSILTLSYLGADRVFPNYNVMGVAKAALEASVRYLASDLGPKGIRDNAISAGPIKTLAASGISGFSNILQTYRDRAPLRRTVETSEVADAAIFLLGPAGRAVTAEVLLVDGGFHAMGI